MAHRSRIWRSSAIFVVVVLATALPATAFAGTTTFVVGGETVTVTISDAAFQPNGCVDVPGTLEASGRVSLGLAASQKESSDSVHSRPGPIDMYKPGQVPFEIEVCDIMYGAGTYIVRVEDRVPEVRTPVPIPDGLQFTVSRAPSKFAALVVKQRGSTVTTSGRFRRD